jgi:Protein of unknown function (DUF4035)
MLQEISWENFLEWRVYRKLAVPGEAREDYRNAHLIEALYTIALKGNVTAKTEDFLLFFGDDPRRPSSQKEESKPSGQTVEQMERILTSWTYVNNAYWAKQPS